LINFIIFYIDDNYSGHSSPKDKSPKSKESNTVRDEIRKILDDIRPELRNAVIHEDRVDTYEEAINNLLDAKE